MSHLIWIFPSLGPLFSELLSVRVALGALICLGVLVTGANFLRWLLDRRQIKRPNWVIGNPVLGSLTLWIVAALLFQTHFGVVGAKFWWLVTAIIIVSLFDTRGIHWILAKAIIDAYRRRRVPAQLPNNLLARLLVLLDDNIHALRKQGFLTLAFTLVLGFTIYIDIKRSLVYQLNLLDNSVHPNQVLAYLVFRSSALGVIATTILYFGARLTIASFDQSVRFTKRKLGTMFLNYLYVEHKDQIKQEVSLGEIMTSFEIWNKTVESAFSNIKTERGDNMLGKFKDAEKGAENARNANPPEE
jgi:hypothetical protein